MLEIIKLTDRHIARNFVIMLKLINSKKVSYVSVSRILCVEHG